MLEERESGVDIRSVYAYEYSELCWRVRVSKGVGRTVCFVDDDDLIS